MSLHQDIHHGIVCNDKDLERAKDPSIWDWLNKEQKRN